MDEVEAQWEATRKLIADFEAENGEITDAELMRAKATIMQARAGDATPSGH